MANYWTSVMKRRLRRRAVLTGGATLGGGLLAATMFGCGDGDEESGESQGLAAVPGETTSNAKRGGSMQAYMESEGAHFDAPAARAAEFAHTLLAYSRLVRPVLGTAADPPDGSVEGDAASSWEWSPDGLQLTFKMREGMKYEPRPPLNGREISAEDVKYGWDRFVEANPSRGDWAASANPDAPVESLETPDSSTVVVKLAFPLAAILPRFSGSVYVFPVEADGGFDPKQEMRGSGPWMMTEYQPSVGWKYERNPNWFWAEERPYLDGIDFALLPEATVRFAQYQAQSLWYLEPAADDDVVGFKQENPESLLVAFNPRNSGGLGGYQLTLSTLPDSPLHKDVRLRHAISLLIDRDAWIDTFYNVSNLESQGVEMESAWNSSISCTAREWLDPTTDQLGEDAKWYQHNPEEAANLLRAADSFGIEQPFSYATSGPFSQLEARKMQVIAQMLQQDGHFKLKIETGDFTNWALPTFFRGAGQYEGISWTSGNMRGDDLDAELWSFYSPGGRSACFDSWDDVPGLEDIMKRARAELDDEKRTGIYHELQHFLAQNMPAIMWPGIATNFNLYWAWMGNAGVYRVLGDESAVPRATLPYVWYDEAKDERSS